MSQLWGDREKKVVVLPYLFTNTFYCISSLVLADIPPPEVNIIADTTSVAGQAYSLLCRVTVPDGLMSEPQIVWRSPQGNILSSGGEIIVGNQPVLGNPSRLTTYSIQFSPLLTSHSGTYTCLATITSPCQTIQKSVSRTVNVSVKSKTTL